MTANKTIYTYIEESNLHSYLSLCIDTWKKNLPEGYKIITLNKKNLFEYISAKTIPDSLTTNIGEEKVCSFPYFYDFLASAVLHNNGGIFLKPDTIMTDRFVPPEDLLLTTDLVMYSARQNDIHNGFLMANKNSFVLEELIRRFCFASYLPRIKDNSKSFILNDFLNDFSLKEAIILESEDCGYLMEKSLFGIYNEYLYKKYYFTNICSEEEFFQMSKGITALNDAFTPPQYKQMDKKEFLEQDILLSKIFKKILTAQAS